MDIITMVEEVWRPHFKPSHRLYHTMIAEAVHAGDAAAAHAWFENMLSNENMKPKLNQVSVI